LKIIKKKLKNCEIAAEDTTVGPVEICMRICACIEKNKHCYPIYLPLLTF